MSALLWLSLSAAAVPPEALSEDRKQPTTVWLLEDAVPVDAWSARECKPKDEGSPLPAGLRARAHLTHDNCGGAWAFLDLEAETGSKATRSATVRLDQISLAPPKHAGWERLSDGPLRYIYGGRKDPEPAVPLDDPSWTELYWLGSWEPVVVLDAEAAIVRTQGGRVLQTSDRWLEEEPKYLPSDKERYLAHLSYFQAGRVAREQGTTAPLMRVPASEQLLADRRALAGHPYVLRIFPEALHSPQYAPEWLEPVGQVSERACVGNVDRWEACGAYYLDYSAFGAWRPEQDLVVVAVADGVQRVDGRDLPRLRVMVRDPFGDRVQVAPSWDKP